MLFLRIIWVIKKTSMMKGFVLTVLHCTNYTILLLPFKMCVTTKFVASLCVLEKACIYLTSVLRPWVLAQNLSLEKQKKREDVWRPHHLVNVWRYTHLYNTHRGQQRGISKEDTEGNSHPLDVRNTEKKRV